MNKASTINTSEGFKSRNRTDDSMKQRSYTSGNEMNGYSDVSKTATSGISGDGVNRINGFTDISKTSTSGKGGSEVNGFSDISKTETSGVVNSSEDKKGIRRRANALEGKRQATTDTSPTIEVPTEEQLKRLSDKFDDQSFPEFGHRARTGSTKDVKRSGSFNMRRQMSGDKALGIFYHNRRSQMLEQESGDEGERKSLSETFLERSGSYSSPHSPISARASNLKGVRDSGEVNTPMSPLLSSNSSSDMLTESLRNMRKNERAERAELSTAADRGPPLSPSIVVNNDAESSDVSAFQGKT